MDPKTPPPVGEGLPTPVQSGSLEKPHIRVKDVFGEADSQKGGPDVNNELHGGNDRDGEKGKERNERKEEEIEEGHTKSNDEEHYGGTSAETSPAQRATKVESAEAAAISANNGTRLPERDTEPDLDDITIRSTVSTTDESDSSRQHPTDIALLLELTEASVNELSLDDCRAKLNEALKVIRTLQLQNKLLTIQAHEESQRYEVENSIIKREVDRLRMENAKAEEEDAGAAEVYRRRLKKAKSRIKDLDIDLAEKDEEINRLKKRLRERNSKVYSASSSQGRTAGSGTVVLPPISTVVPSASPPRHDFEGTLSSPTTGLDTLSMIASQVFNQHHPQTSQPSQALQRQQHQPPMQHFSNSLSSPQHLSPVSSPLRSSPHKSQGSQSLALGPLALEPSPSSPFKDKGSSPQGLMSPVAFEKRRRESSASTISLPSEDEDAEESSQVQYGSPKRLSK